MLRSVLEGKWREIHDNIIRTCKIFIFINTLEALESLEIMREISIAFPNGDTSKHSFWILRDKLNAALNSSAFQERTGINLASQNQAPFGNESDFNTIIIKRCRDDRERLKEKLETQVNSSPPEGMYLTIKVRFPA